MRHDNKETQLASIFKTPVSSTKYCPLCNRRTDRVLASYDDDYWNCIWRGTEGTVIKYLKLWTRRPFFIENRAFLPQIAKTKCRLYERGCATKETCVMQTTRKKKINKQSVFFS